MKANLARTFVQLGIINRGTVLEALQSAKGLSGVCDSHKLTTYTVVGARATPETVTFETVGPDKLRYRVPCEFVRTLDGMEVERVAASHHLTEDGVEIVKRRRQKSSA